MAEARKKSPRAPSMSLEDALERAVKVYEKERSHAAPTDVIAQHIGYKNANNGAALAALASMRYFGLLERPQDGMLAVSRDVETYKFAPDDAMRGSLLRKFLLKPAVFADLLEKYRGGLPSEANLRFELIQRGFSPDSAQATGAVFRKSVEFVDFFATQESTEDSCEAEVFQEVSDEGSPAVVDGRQARKGSVAPDDILAADGSEVDRIPVRLSGNRKAWLIIPPVFYQRDKERIKAQIDLLLSSDDDDQY